MCWWWDEAAARRTCPAGPLGRSFPQGMALMAPGNRFLTAHWACPPGPLPCRAWHPA
jgi:hypothetical protein